MGRAYIIENGQPALVMFRAGATDGRMTQVLPFERPPNVRGPEGGGEAPPREGGGGMRMNGAGAGGLSPEEMRKAFERKLEPGAKVIVDSGAPAP